MTPFGPLGEVVYRLSAGDLAALLKPCFDVVSAISDVTADSVADRSCHQHPGLPRSNYEMAVEWTRDGVLPAISAAVVATWRSDVPLTSS